MQKAKVKKMNHTELQHAYEQAYKSGKQAWNQKLLKGESGTYVPQIV